MMICSSEGKFKPLNTDIPYPLLSNYQGKEFPFPATYLNVFQPEDLLSEDRFLDVLLKNLVLLHGASSDSYCKEDIAWRLYRAHMTCLKV